VTGLRVPYPAAADETWESIPRYNLSMPLSYEEVRKIAYELPDEQRILLAESLCESVDIRENHVGEAEVDAAWDGEIARRVAEIKAGTAVTYSLEEVEAEMRAIVGP
jgi:putative addiction module component (TIGR02574 family)